uniref:molybdopterin biosynthesis protein n=1 Tax=Timspurckia oligopyrenoides TaxID=708627 RepID=UPI001FCD5086|nr:molybdopterin biosynthesis protein [Timspurckia oligopyrenoides]UNJ17535.1 molybdopterin biosynthesis protein [Timspurckia oligopyrenoides]
MLNPNIGLQLSELDKVRYIKQLILHDIEQEGQQRLKMAKILFVGAGGLASSSILYLVATGIEHIGIVDEDEVELSNLQRQVIHSIQTLGQLKVESSYKRIKEINPSCKVYLYPKYLNDSNAHSIIKQYDIVIDASDNIEARLLIDKVCQNLNKPYLYAAISELEGQVSVFNYQKGARYTDIYQSANLNAFNNCHTQGVLSVLPGIIGLFQATEVIKIILGVPTVLNKQLLTYNGFETKWNQLNINSAVIKCATNRRLVIADRSQSEIITKQALVRSDRADFIIDVRTRHEFIEKRSRFYSNSVNIPMHVLLNDKQLDLISEEYKTKNIIIYCNSQSRGKIAVQLLKRHNISAHLAI